jgi:hypothetical protein
MTTPWLPPGLAELGALNIKFEIEHQQLDETLVQWEPSYRIIASEYAGENLFDRLLTGVLYSGKGEAAATLREIADLTNPLVLAEMGQIELVSPDDRIYGRGTGLIMAAFTFPGPPSRFADGSAGTYYMAKSLDTATAETRYRANIYLRGSGPCVTEKTVIEATLSGRFLDVRRGHPAPAAIYDPTDYRAGQSLGSVVRRVRGFGILYDSVRHAGGECVAVMRPPVLQHAVAVRTLQYVWDGGEVVEVR